MVRPDVSQPTHGLVEEDAFGVFICNWIKKGESRGQKMSR